MNVSLTPELEAFINEQVATGRYRSASEAVRASIRLLLDQTAEREARLELLQSAIDRGIAELDGGETVDGESAFATVLEGLRSRE